MKEWSIYKITNTINDRLYIGITCQSVAARWKAHVKNAQSQRFDVVLASAIRKHGAEAFRIEVVVTAVDFDEAACIERGLIAQWGTMVPTGYNMTAGGEARWGRSVSPEVRAKMSASAKARSPESRKMSPEARAACSRARKAIMTDEMRKNIGNFHRGKVLSAETREKLRIAGKAQVAAQDREAVCARLAKARAIRWGRRSVAKPAQLSLFDWDA